MASKRIVIALEPRSIDNRPKLPEKLSFMGQALQHQVNVFEKAKDHDIILDLAPTGTGKTKAAFTVLLNHPNRDQNAVYIAPTNALVDQQKQAAEEFVQQAGLPHFVIAASAKEIRTWSNDRVGSRPGEKIYNLLRNPATIFPEVGANRPVLLVTNPDIFYLATFFAYNRLDRVNIASQFYNQFATVIFDEFHLYDAKQLVGLFFYLALSYEFDFFKNGRRVILLTATPEPACSDALSYLERHGVKIASINTENRSTSLLPSQTSVNLELRSQLDRDEFLSELTDEILRRVHSSQDKYGAVILDSLDLINRLSDILQNRGLASKVGRITGASPLADRQRAMQCQIILATSTVDVGFNFERLPSSNRQNLDWLIFSCCDRSAFWQRIGRVGRVLGKKQTDVLSEAIAYLPEKAWNEGIDSLDCSGGRAALKQKLAELSCLDKPFLNIYWQSEAFLEIARPLLKLEEMMEGLAESKLIANLYNTLRSTLGGKRDWDYYRQRMMALQAAESVANSKEKELKDDPLKFYPKAKWAIISTFLKSECPEDWEDLQAKRTKLQDYENAIKKDSEVADCFKAFCKYFSASYAPLFQFRSSLFESLKIQDPKGFILDLSDETLLDPIHLLKNYEFAANGEFIEIIDRADPAYQVSFRWRFRGNHLDFLNTQVNKLKAFENCCIQRKRGNAIAPTPLLTKLEKELIPGAIICKIANAPAYYKLIKERISTYSITVSGNDFEREYTFLPGISGILTIAMYGVRLRLPDNEDFLIF